MSRWRVFMRWTVRSLLGLLAVSLLILALAWSAVRASRPQLDGEIALPGLRTPLSLSRDERGTLLIDGADRLDVARGLGFVHAQERFFEMDLTRRSASGELSALFGIKALSRDRERRVHRLRARLTERFAAMSPQDRALLTAYCDGVNTGLHALTLRPWPYLLLRAEPQDWTPVDSLLVISEMYFMLQSGSIEAGLERALLRERAGDTLFDWLHPRGGRWDAPLDGSTVPEPPMPTAGQFDLRQPARAADSAPSAGAAQRLALDSRRQDVSFLDLDGPRALDEAPVIGSNQWAVAGTRSTHGGAILADDMHLGLGVPSLWFRAQFHIGPADRARMDNAPAGAEVRLRAAGVTLPGLPALIVGSNGRVAWGFTNAYGQWFDWVPVPEKATVVSVDETIEIKGEPPQVLTVREFQGAPIVAQDGGRALALHWIAHEGEAYNLALDEMLQARHASEALAIAQRAGMPHQNLLAADRDGQIGWTIAGRLWSSEDGGPAFGRFVDPARMTHAWLRPDQSPQILSPQSGQLWTANNRQLGGEAGRLLGDGGFDLGARAQQIRDRLSERAQHDEASLGAIHLDDEARFMRTWRDRFLPLARASAAHAGVATLLADWNGRADADQAAYRLIRAARLRTLDALWDAWTGPALGDRQRDPKQRLRWRNQFEYSVVRALDSRPAHLLPPAFKDWDALLLAQLDAAAKEMAPDGALAQATWGRQNASRIQHVLAKAIPPLSAWLDMPSVPQSGDSNLPHVAGPAFGQSQRLVVSPGREDQGWLSMPGGQSGHPMSPFYGAGHEDWVAARPTPLLAGPTLHRLTATAGGR